MIVLGDSGFATFDLATGTTTSFGHLIEIASDPITLAGTPQLDLTTGQPEPGRIDEQPHHARQRQQCRHRRAGGPTPSWSGATGANARSSAPMARPDGIGGILTDIFSLYGLIGLYGNNSISGPNGTPGGSGDNVVIGGGGADVITLGGAGNTVIGDAGEATFSTSGEYLDHHDSGSDRRR